MLYVDVVVSGAVKHTEYAEACRNCKERRGAGPMIDFRGKADTSAFRILLLPGRP